jgi:hypothetical protein
MGITDILSKTLLPLTLHQIEKESSIMVIEQNKSAKETHITCQLH